MADGARDAAPTPRFVWAVPAAFLCLLLPTRVAVAVDYGNRAAGAVLAAVSFVLPLLYTVPAGRRVWERYTWWLLAAQTVLTYLPFLVFGRTWVVGLSGLLGGLLLLTTRTPVSWILFAAIVAVEGAIRIGLYDAYPGLGLSYYSWVFVVPIDMGLPLFGLVRLSDLVTDLHGARTELAGRAVIRERLAATDRLRTAIGDRLELVAARSRSALAALPGRKDRAREDLAEAAGTARQALEQVRRAVADHPPDDDPSPPRTAAGTVAPRLALLVLVIDLGVFCVHHAMIMIDAPAGVMATAVGVAAIGAIAALQLYHSLAGQHGVRPRGWRVTLPVQALLPFTDYVHLSLLGLPGFPAGSALLLLRGWRAWLAFAAIAPTMAVYHLWRGEPGDFDGAVYLVGVSTSTGLAVYGLSRLAVLAEQLQATRRELARTAVEEERLRVGRDTHDLLGMGLSALALKCDLASRLIGRDDARAHRELQTLVRLATAARADLRAVTSGDHALTLNAELVAARDVLASGGVQVDVHAELPDGRLPEPIDTVLATVLREAVTNVLRHAAATRCHIDLSLDGGTVGLRVGNDGVGDDGVGDEAEPGRRHEPGPGGQGLGNLAERATALGGRLTASTEDGRFELTVRIPLS